MKTLSIQAMSMLADKLHYLLCWYHCLGSYWCVEMGLHQNPGQDAFKTFLYPFFHGMKDANVSKKIIQIIRENLPKDCPKSLKNCYSGKSLRQSSITELIIHRQLNLTDVLGRSGHESRKHWKLTKTRNKFH